MICYGFLADTRRIETGFAGYPVPAHRTILYFTLFNFNWNSVQIIVNAARAQAHPIVISLSKLAKQQKLFVSQRLEVKKTH